MLFLLNSRPNHILIDSDPRIHDPAALAWWESEDWIQIELGDLRNFFDETSDPQQRFFQGVKIGRWMPAIAFDSADHLCRVMVGGERDKEAMYKYQNSRSGHAAVLLRGTLSEQPLGLEKQDGS